MRPGPVLYFFGYIQIREINRREAEEVRRGSSSDPEIGGRDEVPNRLMGQPVNR